MQRIASKNSGLERQRPRVGVDGGHAIVDAGVADPLLVLGRAEPQVGGPHLDAELAGQEDRLGGAAAAEIEHAHARLQLDGLAEPLGQPQRVGAAADAGDQPVGVVARGARKAIGEEAGVGSHARGHAPNRGRTRMIPPRRRPLYCARAGRRSTARGTSRTAGRRRRTWAIRPIGTKTTAAPAR